MNMKELEAKTSEELTEELGGLAREHFNLRMQRGMSQQPKPHLFKKVRLTIARIKTILGARARKDGK
jgi:large subunit ribosomal protein L29